MCKSVCLVSFRCLLTVSYSVQTTWCTAPTSSLSPSLLRHSTVLYSPVINSVHILLSFPPERTYVSLTPVSDTSRGLFSCTTAEAVQRLVKKGANVDERRADGATPLIVHAELGNGEVVKELIRLNANVNLQDEVCGVMCVCKWAWL